MRTILFSLMAIGLLATAGTAQADEGDLRKYCKSDIERLCKGIAPGGGRLMECLKKNEKSMTVGCAQALQQLKKKMK
jgi:hypothetical protein